MREDDQYNRKLIQELRDDRNNLSDQMRSSEVEARRDIEQLKDRIKILENELSVVEIEQNNNKKERIVLLSCIKPTSQQQQVKNNGNDEYSYEDDFEPESVAEEDDDVSITSEKSVYLKHEKIQEDYDNKSISSLKSEKIQPATNEEEAMSVHTAKYDDDTFEEESVATLKSSQIGRGGSFVDGESCEESVPEIESDSDGDGLFFGSSSKNVSLGIPKFTELSTVSTPSFNNNNNNKNSKLTGSVEVVVSEHAHKKKTQAEINLCDSAPSRLTKKDVQQQELTTKSLVSLSGAPLLNNENKKGEFLIN